MKRKLLSLILVLMLCFTPTFFLAGCDGSTGDDITFTAGTWTVAEGGSFESCTVTGLSITYTENKYDPAQGKYVDTQKTITTFADALNAGLVCASGFDSSTVGTGLKMTVVFGAESFVVEYSVTATGGGNS